MKKRLSKNAYGGVKGSEYVPFNTDETLTKTENSYLVLIIGIILAIIFAASTTYSGMKTGLTVAAGIPGTVIGAGIMKAFGKDNILSPTLLQGMSSGGESIASGLIYVLPSIIIIGGKFTLFEGILVGVAGSLLGIAIASIVQKNLIVEEHGNLMYPEAMAISETLVATEEGGEALKFMLIGSGIGAVYAFIGESFKNLVNKYYEFVSHGAYRFRISLDVNPMLIGIGFIVGLDVAKIMMAGTLLSVFALNPMIAYFTQLLPDTVVAWNNPSLVVNTMSVAQINGTYTKYVGAGAMLGGGIISALKLVPVVVSSLKELTNKSSENKKESKFGKIILITGVVLLIASGLFISKGDITIFILATLLSFVFILVFSIVSGRVAGSLGTSNLPVSGMTIASLVVMTIMFVALGTTEPEENKVLLLYGAIIVTAIATSGGYVQSQKVAFIMGGSENHMLKNFTIAALFGVLTVVSVILLAVQSPDFVNDFAIPQATLMATLTQGILEGNLPWVMVFAGVAIAIVLFIFDLPVMSIATGIYLPMDIIGVLFIGATLRYLVTISIKEEDREKRIGNGISMSAGLVAGSSLVGIAGMFILLLTPEMQSIPAGFFATNTFAMIQLGVMLTLIYYFIVVFKPKNK